MKPSRIKLLALFTLLMLLMFSACGGDDDGGGTSAGDDDTGAGSGPQVTIASFGFGESEILANIYGKALEAEGIKVNYKLKLGAREIVAPALEKGDIDIVPEYVGNLLAFYDANASEPGDDVEATTSKLRELAKAKKLTVLEPSEAADGDVLAMTKKKADELGVKKISDLKGKESSLVMGGPPECAQRITCYKGLQDVYGLRFREFKALDTGGPITVKSLKDGDVDVARLFSSDPAIKSNDFVVLEDDQFIQPAGNVVPVVRDEALTDEIKEILNKVSAALTTEDLIDLNTRVDVEKEDAAAVAEDWIKENL
ncbi:MAG TPA: ABC transporter substrate-binding protein [Acidimicrobiales bacterium]|jgi:osmoprotectant transport system substrate-binding protein|nr:ABC transporter substrate-binding protein [Acidimicrobiales bacterium]